MTLLTRHLGFLQGLREAGMPVSLAEGRDAVAALAAVGWDDRETVRTAYAATLLKRSAQRPTFDTLFDLYFPPRVGDGGWGTTGDGHVGHVDRAPGDQQVPAPVDGPDQLSDLRDRLAQALAAGADEPAVGTPALDQLVTEAVGRFGALPGRGAGQSAWSAYQTLRGVAPEELAERIAAVLGGQGRSAADARSTAEARVADFRLRVEAEVRRRVSEEKGPGEVARSTLRPTVDRIDFTSARRDELAAMRREIYPLARRLATRLTREQHARRRGRLDMRRTVRASLATGGVPLETRHRPKLPRRTDLVVLCDVSGSVAGFARFTLLLVHALREQLGSLRAFTFVDDVVEVTDRLVPGADPGRVMADLAASAAQAALWGRTDYGRALSRFAEHHGDAVGPRSSLLILGDARSNYSDPAVPVLADLVRRSRHAWWLNPEHPRHWGTGDSAARRYAEVVDMVECRNLAQLSEFVHDVL